MKKKVVLMGLDGATFDLIDPWIKEGYLPTFESLINNGTKRTLRSTFPPLTIPAWPCIFTGANPGKLGVFGFMKIESVTPFKLKMNSAKDITYPRIWDILGKHRLRSIVVNIPLTYPPAKINGVLISGMETPSKSVQFTHPRSIESQLKDYIIEPELSREKDYATRFKKNLRSIYMTTEKRFKIIKKFIKKERWDFLFFLIRGTDVLQHFHWGEMDILRRYYQYIDSELSELHDMLDKNTDLIIISDHGFGVNKKINFNVNKWLEEGGFLELKKDGRTALVEPAKRIGLTWKNLTYLAEKLRIRELVRENVPLGKIKNLLPVEETIDTSQINFHRTLAYAFDTSIFINKPADKEGVRREIMEKLKSIKDPVTKKRLGWDVSLPEERYHGPFTQEVGDVLFDPYEHGYNVNNGLSHDAVWDTPSASDGYVIEGGHRRDGIFIATGAGINPSTIPERIDILDITPLVLSLFDVPRPDYMDGKPFGRIGVKSVKMSLPDREMKKSGGTVFSEEEEEVIKERLRRLGYL